MHPAQAAITAAEAMIGVLRRGGSIGTDDLLVIVAPTGEPMEMLRRRRLIGYTPLGDVDAVIERLELYINDLRLELPK